MEINLYILLFIFGIVIFWISTRQNEKDITNTYQFQATFLSLIVWAAMIYSSFNIEYVYVTGTVYKASYIDYTYMGVSLCFFILTLLNMIILGIYGSWNMLYKARTGRNQGE
jgi:hypothetical protein